MDFAIDQTNQRWKTQDTEGKPVEFGEILKSVQSYAHNNQKTQKEDKDIPEGSLYERDNAKNTHTSNPESTMDPDLIPIIKMEKKPDGKFKVTVTDDFNDNIYQNLSEKEQIQLKELVYDVIHNDFNPKDHTEILGIVNKKTHDYNEQKNASKGMAEILENAKIDMKGIGLQNSCSKEVKPTPHNDPTINNQNAIKI